MDLASVSNAAMVAIFSLISFQEAHGDSALLTQVHDHLSNFYTTIEDMRVLDGMVGLNDVV